MMRLYLVHKCSLWNCELISLARIPCFVIKDDNKPDKLIAITLLKHLFAGESHY